MSKPSTSQIIAQGEYLEPDFNPSSLTVAHLLGILGYHNVKYPSQHTKAKLVQLFDDEIKSKSSQFKKERLSRQNSQASDEGIKDGLTGKALSGGRRGPTTRGASRRSSVQPGTSVIEPSRPDPVKRRRSTAEPTVAPVRRRRTTNQAADVVAEESEPEEVEVRKVSRNNGSVAEAGTEARRVAQTRVSEDIDSGWEDNNIFQSGAESSSPARPSPVRPRTRRSSAAPRKQRKSMSEPPQFLLPAVVQEDAPKRTTRRQTSVKPPESEFKPSLPDEVFRDTRTRSNRRQAGVTRETNVIEIPTDVEDHLSNVEEEPWAGSQNPVAGPSSSRFEDVPTEEPEEPVGDSEPGSPKELLEPERQTQEQEGLSQATTEATSDGFEDDQTVAVSQRIAEGGKLVRRKPKSSSTLPNILRFFLALMGVGTLTTLYNYKTESAPIGFCNTGTKSNEVLETLRVRRAAVEECNRENRTVLFSLPHADAAQSVPSPSPPSSEGTEDSQLVLSEPCPVEPLVPIPAPDTCAPCPAYASCSPQSMTCDTGYLLRPHPFLFFLSLPRSHKERDAKSLNTYTIPAYAQPGSSGDMNPAQLAYLGISYIFDGAPGLGPVAFPPRCVEDPRRKRHIGALGRAVEGFLAAERGRRVCAGVGWKEQPGSQAEEAQRWGVEVEVLKDELRRKASPRMMDAFEDTWNEAIEQLLVWGGVFIGEDEEGKRYLAHRTPQMDLSCTVTVKARESWEQWRKQIFATLALIGTAAVARRRRSRSAKENDRVAVLAQSALNLLRSQELAHYTDPVTAPHPYLPSLQLRDLILQDEPSISTRRRLWAGVERVVEENTNIRTNLEEVEGGNEERVWRWVGSAGKSLPQATD